ncbi:3-oxoacyl-[acyl-carrier-protein] synthase II [Streptomyces sp. NBRC 110611]|nr:3-oxoacyl-[acyl-carrier-protein] synthase II [Streptomyces sp. NBRC 110611]
MSGARRVVVTGLGSVTAAGTGTDALWRDLLVPAPSAPPGHRPLKPWDAGRWMDRAEIRHTDRCTQFAVASAELAVADAGGAEALTARYGPERAGVVLGTALGGVTTMERQSLVRAGHGDRRVSPFTVPMVMPNAAAAAVSQRLGWQGPCETVTTACASGTHAIASAARLIAYGVCDTVLTGGTEAAAHGTVLAGFTTMRALSATGRTRPFDRGRDGFTVAEGAAALVLEAADTARARGATVLAEVLGAASTADAHDVTMPLPDGSGAARCMALALRDAALAPSDIAQISAHGTGTLQGDLAESRALERVFGTAGPAVTSAKGATGHVFGASGALEAVAAVLSMVHGLIPPVQGLVAPDPGLGPGLDLVRGAPRRWTPGPVLSNSFGFGGHNGSLILGPCRTWTPPPEPRSSPEPRRPRESAWISRRTTASRRPKPSSPGWTTAPGAGSGPACAVRYGSGTPPGRGSIWPGTTTSASPPTPRSPPRRPGPPPSGEPERARRGW